ncbi:MAG TPA: RNA polymerase factor sigma-54, partial [Candidatus Omnitrophota bacterium]|nr:RNA polymerase factor sigma-54 [Candidatus Omnitrophota bacterium]
KALSLIQSFEPSGVGARNLKECLLIQLAKSSDQDLLSRRLVEDHLEELAEKDRSKLCKKLKTTPEELEACLAKIQRLEPKPGRGFSTEETVYAIPDIFIEEKNEGLEVRVKDDVIPVIRVNPVYRNMLKGKKIDEKTKEFIKERIARANNLIRAIEGRKDTLLKVLSLITETQKEAIMEGIGKLKPLSIKEIALKTGLHESTISRVVANKYVQAPAGIFPVKALFSTAVKTEGGDDIASQKIKSKIRDLIDAEEKTKPLKDHEIARLINETEHTSLARRTIAKYRESLDIPPVSKRKHQA